MVFLILNDLKNFFGKKTAISSHHIQSSTENLANGRERQNSKSLGTRLGDNLLGTKAITSGDQIFVPIVPIVSNGLDKQTQRHTDTDMTLSKGT